MLGLLKFLNPLKVIGDQLGAAYKAKLDAKNDDDRIKADVTISQLEARQAVLISEQKHRLTRWVRPAFAYPPAFYWGKLFVWDKALGLGTTDPIDDRLWWISMTIIGAYFLTRPFEKRR